MQKLKFITFPLYFILLTTKLAFASDFTNINSDSIIIKLIKEEQVPPFNEQSIEQITKDKDELYEAYSFTVRLEAELNLYAFKGLSFILGLGITAFQLSLSGALVTSEERIYYEDYRMESEKTSLLGCASAFTFFSIPFVLYAIHKILKNYYWSSCAGLVSKSDSESVDILNNFFFSEYFKREEYLKSKKEED